MTTRIVDRNYNFAGCLIIPSVSHDWSDVIADHKFGANPAAGTAAEDIWSAGGTYAYPATAVTMYISSDAEADQGLTYTVNGLDANWAVQTVTGTTNASDGRTFVALSGTWMRVYRAYATGGTAAAGNVYISKDNTDVGGDGIPDTATDIQAKVVVGENQTQMALVTVPAGYTGYLLGYSASVLTGAAAKTADLAIFSKANPTGVFRLREEFGIGTAATSMIVNRLQVAISLPEKTDIKVRLLSSSATSIIAAHFDMLYVKNAA